MNFPRERDHQNTTVAHIKTFPRRRKKQRVCERPGVEELGCVHKADLADTVEEEQPKSAPILEEGAGLGVAISSLSGRKLVHIVSGGHLTASLKKPESSRWDGDEGEEKGQQKAQWSLKVLSLLETYGGRRKLILHYSGVQ